MKDILITLIILLLLAIIGSMIPAKETEIHIGSDMNYNTDMADDVSRNIKLLKQIQ